LEKNSMPANTLRTTGIAVILAAGVTLTGVAPASAAVVAAPASTSSLEAALAKAGTYKSIAAPTAQQSANKPAIALKFHWWGARLNLNREAGCWASMSHPEFERLLDAIPEPWRTVVRVAIAAHKWMINKRMGSEGIYIDFNWAGFIHFMGPEGNLKPC
jgi:hypothetical protein